MRLLDRYLLRELVIPLAYCLSGFLIFWIAFDLFTHLGEFQDKHLKGKEVLEYYVITTPEMLSTVLPIALLLGLLYALTNHARYHELTAMRSAGISLWRLALPYFAVGLFSSVLLFVNNEIWAPANSERADDIRNKRTHEMDVARNLNFRNERERRWWTIGAYNLKTHEMTQPNVRWELPNGGHRDLHAAKATFNDGIWKFYDVQLVDYKSRTDVLPDITTTNLVTLTLSETPELIRSETKINSLRVDKATKQAQIPLKDILNYLRLHPQLSPKKSAEINTQLHGRLASPWTCLVVVLIALPFGAPSGRRNVFVGVASSIFICFTYFILQTIGLSLGTGGKLPPAVAAWLPNAFFGTIGIWLTSRVR